MNEFIYEELERLFDEPRNYSPIDEYMNENCGLWCKRFCGKIDGSKCWREYFMKRELEERKNATRVR